MIQTLESRVHLDASYDLGLLSVVGTNSADKIALSIVNNRVQVVLNGVTTSYGGVKRLLVGGLGGDDQISIAPNITRPATIDAGDGNDAIAHGGGNDTVFGGAGDDLILGAQLASVNDRDSLLGEAGNDTLVDNGGNDVLRGGANNDRLENYDGKDALLGEAGDDTIVINGMTFTIGSYYDAGAGEDTFDFSGLDFHSSTDGVRIRLYGELQIANDNGSLLTFGFIGLRSETIRRARIAGFENIIATAYDDDISAGFDGRTSTQTNTITDFVIDAGAGDDQINFSGGNADNGQVSLDRTTLIGGEGDESIACPSTLDIMPVIDAGSGNDHLSQIGVTPDISDVTFGTGSDSYWHESAFGTLAAFTMPADLEDLTLRGSGNYPSVTGNGLSNIIHVEYASNVDAGNGDDSVIIDELSGSLLAGAGDDRVYVGRASTSATVNGGDDDDRLETGGVTTVRGGNGADRIHASGATSVFGDAGNDRIVVETDGNVGVAISGGAGNDYIVGSIGADTVDLLDTERDTYIGTGGGDDVDADAIDLVLQI